MKARTLLQDVMVEIGAIGANETMSPAQAQLGLRTLNRILDGWQARRLMVPAITEVVATVSGISATIGTGMTFDTPAPLALHRGCYYVRSGLSFPLPVIDRDSYSGIQQKTMSGDYLEGVYYDRQGTVWFYPVPSGPAAVHLMVLQRLSTFATLDTTHTLPDGYEEALHLTSCEIMPPQYQLPVRPDVAVRAAAARRVLKRNNTDVPVLTIDAMRGAFNILTNG